MDRAFVENPPRSNGKGRSICRRTTFAFASGSQTGESLSDVGPQTSVHSGAPFVVCAATSDDPCRWNDDGAPSSLLSTPTSHDRAGTSDVRGESFDDCAVACFVRAPTSEDRGQWWDGKWPDPRTLCGIFARFPPNLPGRRTPRSTIADQRATIAHYPSWGGREVCQVNAQSSFVGVPPSQVGDPSSWVDAPSSGVDAPLSKGGAQTSWVDRLPSDGG
jgi:hypothetical protein